MSQLLQRRRPCRELDVLAETSIQTLKPLLECALDTVFGGADRVITDLIIGTDRRCDPKALSPLVLDRVVIRMQ